MWPMKRVSRGDEFPEGQHIGTLVQNNSVSGMPKLVDFDICALSGVNVPIGRLKREVVALSDRGGFSDREVASTYDIESRAAVNNPRAHGRMGPSPPRLLGASAHRSREALKAYVRIGTDLEGKVSALPPGTLTIHNPEPGGIFPPCIGNGSHVLARRSVVTVGCTLKLGLATRK